MTIRAVPDAYETDTRGDMRIFGWQFDYRDPADLLPVTLFTRDPATNPTASIPLAGSVRMIARRG